ncbi:MAG: ABC transporter permease [Beijerinckiaceae bacterium]|jgi:ribose transport system permease protein
MTDAGASIRVESLHLKARYPGLFSQKTIVFAIFVVLFAVLSVFVPSFLTVPNLLSLLQSVAILGILGLGMAVVVIGRGIDLSMIASLVVPPGILLQLVQMGHSVPFAVVVSLAIAIAFGLINGWLIAYAEVPSLFATLASGLFLAGFGQVFFFVIDVVQWSPDLHSLAWMGRGEVLGVPKPVIMFAVAAAIMAAFLRQTRLGAFIYAIGDNLATARATGVPTRPLIVLQYLIAALVGAFAGMVMAASLESMPTRTFNSTLIYDVILVVVLGGIGLSGGRGGVSNVVIGTLLIGTLLNGMTLMDLSYSAQNFIKGLILLCAVVFDSLANPRNEETAQQGDI